MTRRTIWALLMLTACGSPAEPAADAGPLDAGAAIDAAPDAPPCTDSDDDGACAADDCDDADPTRSPGLTEVCDVDDLDEDCDPTTFGARDGDGDGSIDARCCNGSTCGDDCDDARPNVHPGATELCNDTDDDCDGAIDDGAAETRAEVCNGMDDDCDGTIDDGVLVTFHADADGDGFGAPGDEMLACTAPVGYVASATDCDDTQSAVHPAAVEVCDALGVDENCSGSANEDCSCAGGTSRPCSAPGRCAAGIETCIGGSWGTCSLAPIAETCNGVDDDCDGAIDDGLTVTCYADADGDTYASAGASPMSACPAAGREAFGGCPVGTTDRAPAGTEIDCDDASPTIHPAATEICDAASIDEDCDGVANDGCP